MKKDLRGYYRILQVSVDATPEQIKQSYRALAKALHPDLNQGRDTTAAFQKVNEAYSVLSDPNQRQDYDAEGVPTGRATTARASSPSRSQEVRVEPFSCVDCGCISPKLRHIKYTQVVSYLIGSYRTNVWGVFCEDCAKRRLTKASIVTGVFGWMSVPGMFFSAHALARNLTGGKQENSINMEICGRQALYYAMAGENSNARIAAVDGIEFAKAIWWSEDAKKRAAEVRPILEDLLRKLR